MLAALLDGHAAHTGKQADTVVADAQYGTVENLLTCHERGVKTHMPHLGQAAQKRNAVRGVFGEDKFFYDAEHDVLVCPAGQTLTRQGLDLKNHTVSYGAHHTNCSTCSLRPQCTQNKAGRRVRRHVRQDVLDHKHKESSSTAGRRDIRTRQHLMERSFARSKRYGYDRARWRGLWRVEIQELLTCTVQNIQVLVSRMRPRPTVQAHRRRPSRRAFEAPLRWLLRLRDLLAAVAQGNTVRHPFVPEPA